jgi:hypothetical protein
MSCFQPLLADDDLEPLDRPVERIEQNLYLSGKCVDQKIKLEGKTERAFGLWDKKNWKVEEQKIMNRRICENASTGKTTTNNKQHQRTSEHICAVLSHPSLQWTSTDFFFFNI